MYLINPFMPSEFLQHKNWVNPLRFKADAFPNFPFGCMYAKKKDMLLLSQMVKIRLNYSEYWQSY